MLVSEGSWSGGNLKLHTVHCCEIKRVWGTAVTELDGGSLQTRMLQSSAVSAKCPRTDEVKRLSLRWQALARLAWLPRANIKQWWNKYLYFYMFALQTTLHNKSTKSQSIKATTVLLLWILLLFLSFSKLAISPSYYSYDSMLAKANCQMTAWQDDAFSINSDSVVYVTRPQWTGLLVESHPTSSPTTLLFISEAKAGDCRSCGRCIASALPLTLSEEEGHSAFWFKLFCAMTTLQGAAALKEHYTQPAHTQSTTLYMPTFVKVRNVLWLSDFF